MLRRLSFFFIVCAMAWPASPLSAQGRDPAEITIEGDRDFPVFLGRIRGDAGSEVSSVVLSNLQRAGSFEFRSKSSGAYVIEGKAADDRVEGRLFDPRGKAVFQRLYRGSRTAALAQRFADDVIEAITGQKGIGSSRIAFVSDASGKKELYLCTPTGEDIRQVTRDQSLSVSPAISPDGQKLAYTGYLSGYADVYLIDLPTGKRERIIAEPGTNTGSAISPDGSKIALTMSMFGNPELAVTPIQGGSAKRLTQSKAVESSPAWSPNGRELVFVSDATGSPKLYRIPATGGRPVLIDTGFSYCVEPSWSPDGARLAFNTRKDGRNHVAIHDFSSGSASLLTSGSPAEDPVWGPDSVHLLYVQAGDLYLHNTETGSRERIVSDFGTISEPTWTR